MAEEEGTQEETEEVSDAEETEQEDGGGAEESEEPQGDDLASRVDDLESQVKALSDMVASMSISEEDGSEEPETVDDEFGDSFDLSEYERILGA